MHFKQPSLLIGGVLLLLGVLLLVPTILAMVQSRIVLGRLVDVLPRPLDDQHVTMQLVFEYPLEGSLDAPDLLVLGWGRHNQDDEHEPILRSQWAQVAAPYIKAKEDGRVYPVIFQANDPYNTARIETDEASLWQITVGIACIATPLVLWLSRLLGQSFSLLVRPRTQRKGAEQ